MSDPIHIGDRVRYKVGRGYAEGIVSMVNSADGLLWVRHPISGRCIRKKIADVKRVPDVKEKPCQPTPSP